MSESQQYHEGVEYRIGKSTGEEFISDVMTAHLIELNKICGNSGTPLEGNLFYKHHTPNIETLDMPDARRVQKRRNFCRAIGGKKNLLEIGFNGGHSALLALSCSPNLRITCVDIGRNSYVNPCANYMKENFQQRFEIIIGDSRDIIPELSLFSDQRFDIIHIDGGHGVKNCLADTANALALRSPGVPRHILLDDTNATQIFEIYQRFVTHGYLVPDSKNDTWEGRESLLARIADNIVRASDFGGD